MKKFTCLMVMMSLCLGVFCSLPGAEESKPIRVLFSGGGDWHPYAQCSGALIDALRKDKVFVCSYSEDPNSLRAEHLKNFDVVVLYNGVYHQGTGKQEIPTPAYIPEGLTKFVSGGGGLICMHSAMASYSDWKDYINLIGGVWVWGTSAHDNYGTLKSRVVARHPITEGLPETFEFQDEFYHTLNVLPSAQVLVDSTHEKGGKTVTEPLVWVAKDTPQERVATILHGHDMGSWGNPVFQQMMKQAIEWAARKR